MRWLSEKATPINVLFLIVAGSLLAFLVLIAGTGTSGGGQDFESIVAYKTDTSVGGGGVEAVDSITVPATTTSPGQDFESIVAYKTDTGGGGGGVEAVDSIAVPATTTSPDSALNMDIFGIAANSDTSGCVGKYHVCAGGGRGNCCNGLECDGPLFGTCQTSASCQKKFRVCAGFGQGNCCAGLRCSTIGVPGAGTCQTDCDTWWCRDCC